MQSFLPVLGRGSDEVDRQKTTRSCQKCQPMSEGTRKPIGCNHMVCGKCLTEISMNFDSSKDNSNMLSCPQCGETNFLPKETKLRRSGGFKVGKESKFYSEDTKDTLTELAMNSDSAKDNMLSCPQPNETMLRRSGGFKVGKGAKDTRGSSDFDHKCDRLNNSNEAVLRVKSDGNKIYPSSTDSESHGRQRSPLRFAGVDDVQRFDSKISTDTKDSVYFGGDIMPEGHIILADWLNSCVKMFSASGQFLCHIKLKEPPVDITAVRKDMIVVSLGSLTRKAVFLAYSTTLDNHNLEEIGRAVVPGYLYSTTRFGGYALGILEKLDTSIILAEVAYKRGARLSSKKAVTEYKLKSDVALSSESGIHYNENDSTILVTSRRKLYCLSRDGLLLFVKDFYCTEDELYHLGSVTCDDQGIIYISSDQCVLKIKPDSGLIYTLPTKKDPYHIIMNKSQRQLLLVGKEEEIVCFHIKS